GLDPIGYVGPQTRAALNGIQSGQTIGGTDARYELVSKLQSLLALLGYYKSEITGVYDAYTQQALTAYSQSAVHKHAITSGYRPPSRTTTPEAEPDPNAPTVSITSPTTGTSFTASSITFAATATDDESVTGVQFKLSDGTLIGSEDVESPYGVEWDITAVSEGSHAVVAVARNPSGLFATSTAVSVIVNNVPDLAAFPYQIAHYIGYGQSHKTGATPTPTDEDPPVSVGAYDDAYMFSGGTRPRDTDLGVTGESGRYASLVPLEEEATIVRNESDEITAYYSETPCTGFARMFWHLLDIDEDLQPANTDIKPLCSIAARTGTEISGLIQNTAPYEDVLADVTAGKELADADGKSYGVLGVFFSQASADYLLDTPADDYVNYMVSLITDLNTDIKAITGQTEDVVLYVIQNSTHAYRNHPLDPYLAHAQNRAAEENPTLIQIAHAMHDHITGVHHDPDESYLDGAYDALAWKRNVVDSSPIAQMVPTTATAQNKIAYLTYPVPSGYTLEWETTFPTKQTRYGFRILTAGGSERTLNGDPIIVGDNQVRLDTANVFVDGDVVTYGDPQGGGNLRVVPKVGSPLQDPVFDVPVVDWALISSTTLAVTAADPKPVYTPETVLGDKLVAYWNADWTNGVTLDESSRVSEWIDMIGDYTLIQATDTIRPSYSTTSFNGVAGVTFDGVDDLLRMSGVPGTVPTGASYSEIWALVDQTALASDADTLRDIVGYGAGSSAYREIRRTIIAGVNRVRATTNNSNATDASTDFSGLHWVRAVWDGTSAKVSTDGNAFTTAAHNAITGTTNITFGNTPSGSATGHQGVIQQVMILNAEPTAGELADLQTYFAGLVD
ncbi:hypothetical protein KKH81_02950, partial [Patescibacteria group bacterium]|nr:hypothetical protein [Patescibacteria group bacterium]